MKKLNIRNILVPIDFSPISILAIETAKHLVQRFGGSIHLAHAREFFYPAGFTAPMPPFVPYSTYTYDHESRKKAELELSELAKQHGLPAATTHVLDGSPAFDQICRFATELAADIIVMPTHGRTGLKHVLLGSTAERVVQHSPCPVFVTREQARRSKNGARQGTIDTILVPVDFSAAAMAGLNYAVSFAEKVAAKINVLHVVELGYAYSAAGYAMYDLSELTKAATKNAERRMREFLHEVQPGRVRVEITIKTGHPVEAICSMAKAQDADLIITSTHGRTGLAHVVMGSVAENLVRRSPCSVLIVPSYTKVRIANSERGFAERRQVIQSAKPDRLSRTLVQRDKPPRKFRKLTAHPFPERRKTNKFREAHVH